MRGLIFRVSPLFMILLFVGYYNGDCEVLYAVGRLMFNSDVATNRKDTVADFLIKCHTVMFKCYGHYCPVL